jgi:hypothetical protein
MKNPNEVFKATLESLLNERLSPSEEQSLKDEGFTLKKPTRKSAVVIALYKKAASGDLAAYRELSGIIGENSSNRERLTIIDDTRD